MPETRQSSAKPADPAGFLVREWIDPGVPRRRVRVLFPKPASNRNLFRRASDALWPWGRSEYPGVTRLRAWLLGMNNLESARAYCKRKVLPRVRAGVVLSKLRAKRAELDALIAELEPLAGRAQQVGPSSEGKLSKVRPSVAPPIVE